MGGRGVESGCGVSHNDLLSVLIPLCNCQVHVVKNFPPAF